MFVINKGEFIHSIKSWLKDRFLLQISQEQISNTEKFQLKRIWIKFLAEAFTENAGELVGHRYGAAAGELFKAGAGVVGNMKLPGKKFLKVKS